MEKLTDAQLIAAYEDARKGERMYAIIFFLALLCFALLNNSIAGLFIGIVFCAFTIYAGSLAHKDKKAFGVELIKRNKVIP